MGNAFALYVNASVVEVIGFTHTPSGGMLVEAWWDSPDEGRFMMTIPATDILVMA